VIFIDLDSFVWKASKLTTLLGNTDKPGLLVQARCTISTSYLLISCRFRYEIDGLEKNGGEVFHAKDKSLARMYLAQALIFAG
jgi:hypothetical protein